MNFGKIILVLTAMFLTACENSEKYQSDIPDAQSTSIVSGSLQEDPDAESGSIENETVPEVNELKISINGKSYTAHFYDTKAAEEFKEMLPLTLNMSELNGNEKYNYLDSDFTTESEKVGSIKKGEIMLYGSNCVVLFYDSFSTPYSYTRLGYIDDPEGIEKAVGSGSVTVEFYTE